MACRALLGLATVICFAAAGCTDRPEQLPTSNTPSLAVSSTCDFKAIRDGVRAYFGPGDQTTVLAIVRQMGDACDAGQVNVVLDRGFDVGAQIERVFYAGTQTGTPARGGQLLQALLVKMGLALPAGANPTSALSPGGAIGVRGGAADANTKPVLANGTTPVWGVAPGTNSDFASMSGGVRFALLGYPTGNFTREANFGTFYKLFRVAPGIFNPEAIVGACLTVPDQALVQKNNSILDRRFPPFCSPSSSTLGLKGSMLRWARDLLVPRPLFATTALAQIGGGGGASTFSDFALVNAVSLGIQFTSDGQPLDGHVAPALIQGSSGEVRILVTAAAGTPMENVTVTITAVINKGNFVVVGGTTSAKTGLDGIAHFTDLTVNKPGGYRMVAAGSLDFYPSVETTSNLFNLQQ